MAQFSQASATATCSGLSVTAQSTSAKIQQLLATGAVPDEALQKQLSVLAARLRTFRQHVAQLGRCIADTPVVHHQLGDVLKSALPECQTALESVPGRLAPGSGGLTEDAIACYETLVMAYVRFWVLATQLLIMCVFPAAQAHSSPSFAKPA